MTFIRLRFIAVALVCLVTVSSPTAKEPASTDAKLVLEQFDVAKDGDGLLLPVRIRGKTYQFVLDTGTSYTVYDTSLRSLLGKQRENIQIDAPGGIVTLDSYEAPDATLGDLSLRTKWPVTLADLKRLSQAAGSQIHGIIGMDFLVDCVVRLDLHKGKVAFLRSPGPNPGDPVRLFFPQKDCPPCPQVSVEIPGGPKEQFLVDTSNIGFISGGLRADLIDRLLKERKAEIVTELLSENLTGSKKKTAYRIDRLLVGPFRHRDLIFGESHENLLGLRYLSRYVATFDFPRKTMYLKKGSRYAQADRWDLSGLHLLRPDKNTVVDSVDKDSPAARSGISPNDVIVKIDAKPAGEMRLFALRELLCSEGQTIRLVMRRRDREFEVSLVLKDRQQKLKSARTAPP